MVQQVFAAVGFGVALIHRTLNPVVTLRRLPGLAHALDADLFAVAELPIVALGIAVAVDAHVATFVAAHRRLARVLARLASDGDVARFLAIAEPPVVTFGVDREMVAATVTGVAPVHRAIDPVVAFVIVRPVLAGVVPLVAGIEGARDVIIARRLAASATRCRVTGLNAVAEDPVPTAGIIGLGRTRIRRLVASILGAVHTVVARRRPRLTSQRSITSLRPITKHPVIAGPIVHNVHAFVRFAVAQIKRAFHAVVAKLRATLFADAVPAPLRAVAEHTVVAIGIAQTVDARVILLVALKVRRTGRGAIETTVRGITTLSPVAVLAVVAQPVIRRMLTRSVVRIAPIDGAGHGVHALRIHDAVRVQSDDVDPQVVCKSFLMVAAEPIVTGSGDADVDRRARGGRAYVAHRVKEASDRAARRSQTAKPVRRVVVVGHVGLRHAAHDRGEKGASAARGRNVHVHNRAAATEGNRDLQPINVAGHHAAVGQ